MLERLKLRAINWAEHVSERKLYGPGIVFVPNSTKVREISQAMLIDGALPSQVNQVTLDISEDAALEDNASAEACLRNQQSEVRDSLLIDGADEVTIAEFTSAVGQEAAVSNKRSLLDSDKPYKKVNLASYNEK